MSQKEDNLAFVDGLVDSPIMSGSLEVKLVREKGVLDTLLPEFTLFGMALQCSHYWEDSSSVNLSTKLELVTIGILVINGDKSRDIMGWRMGKGIISITTIDLEDQLITDC